MYAIRIVCFFLYDKVFYTFTLLVMEYQLFICIFYWNEFRDLAYMPMFYLMDQKMDHTTKSYNQV